MTIAPLPADPPPTSCMRFPDGSMIEIRPLCAADGEMIAQFSGQLSHASEYRRFLVSGGNVRRDWVRRLVQADQVDFLADGAFAVDSFGTTLVAIAESIRSGSEADTAEFALIAADQWQRLGVGTLVARHLSARARISGVRFWEASMLSDNRAISTVLYRIGPRIEGTAAGGVTTAIHALS